MATFEEQIEGLTGITISYSTTVPTQDQLTEFLKNAVLDVTRTSIAVDPHSTFSFARASEKQVNNDYYKNTGQIIEVVRENGTSNDWRKLDILSLQMFLWFLRLVVLIMLQNLILLMLC